MLEMIRSINVIWAAKAKKCCRTCACAKYHLLVYTDRESQDQRRLILAFPVRIYPTIRGQYDVNNNLKPARISNTIQFFFKSYPRFKKTHNIEKFRLFVPFVMFSSLIYMCCTVTCFVCFLFTNAVPLRHG